MLDLTFRGDDIGARHLHLRVGFHDLAPRGLHRRLLLGAVELEDRRPLFDAIPALVSNIDLGDAPIRLGDDRDGSEEQGDVVRRGVVVEDEGDQSHCQHQAGGDAVPELVPERVERDLDAQSLALTVPAIQVVRKQRENRAEQQLEHGQPSAFSRSRLGAVLC